MITTNCSPYYRVPLSLEVSNRRDTAHGNDLSPVSAKPLIWDSTHSAMCRAMFVPRLGSAAASSTVMASSVAPPVGCAVLGGIPLCR
jgi:hypothetical protein